MACIISWDWKVTDKAVKHIDLHEIWSPTPAKKIVENDDERVCDQDE